MANTTRAPLVIDFAPFYSCDAAQKQKLVDDIQQACLDKGFFQLTGHGVSPDLQADVLVQSVKFFALSHEQKMKCDKNLNTYSRGYEQIRAQNFENKGAGDLKEGFYFGRDLPMITHPLKGVHLAVVQMFIPTVSAIPPTSERSSTRCATSPHALSLNLEPITFDEFSQNALAILGLLHYPPQPPDASEDVRGIDAHSDFGGITLLLQDDVGGLQVYDSPSSSWIDVVPTPGAYVVNLGSLMMRWTNDRYVSNLHRVINKIGRERYSIPFFFSGNPVYVVSYLPGCEEEGKRPKHELIKVEDWMRGRYVATYGTSDKTESDMVTEVGKS